MEDSKKKPIMIAIIVVCLGVAIAYTVMRSSGGGGTIDDIPDDKMTWVKCGNPQCNAEYQMGEKAFHKAIRERVDPRTPVTPALICEKCGKASVYRAYKCTNPECGVVFFANSVPNDFTDRCPKCKHSETEAIREARKKAAEGP
jgi:hypothetical protein